MEPKTKGREMKDFLAGILLVGAVYGLCTCISGCTMSWQNIETHGQSEDVVDDNQTNQPNVNPTVTANVSPPLKQLVK